MAPVADSSVKVTMSNEEQSKKETGFTAFKPQKSSFDELLKLSKENRAHDIIYKGFRANHNIHALCSLYSLGAPPSYLQRFFQDSKKYLENLSDSKYEVSEKKWEEFIGKLDSYASYLKFFDREIADKGHIETLKKYLPRLIPGLAGAALHPLIHMGYAVEFDLPLAAAEGLAYACSNYSPLGEAINKVSDKDSSATSSLKLITGFSFEKSKYENAEKKRSFIETRMWGFVEKYGNDLVKLCSDWGCNSDNLLERSDDLAISTVNIFDGSYRQKTLDFFLVHCLTGNHAVRTLMTILETKDQIRLLNLNFMALTVLYAIQGVPSVHSEDSFDITYDGISVTWEELASKASESNDSHVIKAVRNLHQLELIYGQMDGLFHRPAVRCVQDVLSNDWCFDGIGFLSKD